MQRSAGILLHVTSLPGDHGIGDLGPWAYRWIDMLAEARIGWWQILPLVPAGEGNSPYNGASAFAGNPLLISLEVLVKDGWLGRDEISSQAWRAGHVEFEQIKQFKAGLLAMAWQRFKKDAKASQRSELAQFRRKQKFWLDDYSLYAALQEQHDCAPWHAWPKPLAHRNDVALDRARAQLSDRIAGHCFTQFLFFKQLAALRHHARQKGVRFIGDLPIFVSYDSADVWANPHLFQLDRQLRRKVVAGVPPDYFSADGQRWGNPHYDWKAMAADGFRWWINRAAATLQQVDLVRLDHFRGFQAYWAVLAKSPTARKGRWVKAPGEQLFRKLRAALGGLPFIAEDLGLITSDVEQLREQFKLPGMRVLQFGFGGDSNNPFLPHNYSRNAVAYTGTHDNDTTVGWYRQLSQQERRFLHEYAPATRYNVGEELIRLAWGSVAELAVAPLQDVLGLDSRARMNLPGTCSGNWTWRAMEKQLHAGALNRVAEMNRLYARQSSPEK